MTNSFSRFGSLSRRHMLGVLAAPLAVSALGRTAAAASLDEIKKLDPDIASTVRTCYEVALNYGFALMLCITVFAVVSSFFIKEQRLSR